MAATNDNRSTQDPIGTMFKKNFSNGKIYSAVTAILDGGLQYPLKGIK
jgi:hypothetical protein